MICYPMSNDYGCSQVSSLSIIYWFGSLLKFLYQLKTTEFLWVNFKWVYQMENIDFQSIYFKKKQPTAHILQ